MTEETTSVFDTLLLCDDNYITPEHCDPNNWSAEWEEFCEEFDIHDVELVGKRVMPISKVSSIFNGGKKADSLPRDREKLKESYENNKVDKSQYPICIDEAYDTLNGGTRLHPEVLPALGIKAYCFWIVRPKDILARIDFENKVNDPEEKIYRRKNTVTDVETGVVAYANAYKEKNKTEIDQDQLKAKIDEYGGNSLTKKERNDLFKKIDSQVDMNIKPARYKTFTNQSFRGYMNDDLFTDSRKADCIADPSKYWLQNAKNGARWRQHIDEMYRCSTYHKDQSPHPMHQIVLTPPPDEDGMEMQERLDFYDDREKLYRKLDSIAMYRLKNGRYPAQHVDAELLFAPSSHEEVMAGKLIPFQDVLAWKIAKEAKEKQNDE